MAFTLEDLLALPEDVQPEHAERAGLTVPPPAPVPAQPQPPAPMAAAAPPAIASQPEAPIAIDGTRFFAGAEKHPRAQVQPMPAAPTIDKDFSPNAGLGSIDATNKFTTLPTLNFKQRENLPMTSPGVPVNSKAYFDNEQARIDEQKQNPFGSPDNHPGWLGKVGHVAAKIGNIAGDIVAPGTMALIPGTELNRELQENKIFRRGQEAQTGELAKETEGVKERQEDTREQHEENFRQHQLALEDQGNQKIDALFQGLAGKEKKTLNDKEKWLAAIGKKPNPDDPNGAPIDIPDEELSPKQQQQMALLRASVHARDAKAAYDEYKANPNSPQAQAALEKARASTIAAKAAAERAGIAHSRYLADILGEDENGQPLAGVELTDDNRPVGIKVSGAAGKGVTNTTRSMAEMARTVQPQIEKVSKEVQDLSSSLGPAVGRWNDLMTNKGGADFPAFAGLDQDLDLLSSAIVRTHFGARGGQQYREALRKNFGEAQSPEDLLARINSSASWIQGYAQADQQGGAGGPKKHVGDKPTTPAKGGGAPEVPTRTNKRTQEVQEFVNGQWQTKTKPKAAAQP